MNILICHDLNRLDTRKLRRRVGKHGITINTEKHSSPTWNGKYFDTDWRDSFLTKIYKSNRELVDTVMYVPEQWESTKSNLLGFAYRTANPYFLSAVKKRDDWVDTVEHELLHVAYHLIWTYSGIKLEDVFGVDDYHSAIVHGEHPDYVEYEYDDVWEIVAPLLKNAILRRKQAAYLSYRQSLIIRLRELILELRGKISEMEGLLHPVEEYRELITQPYGVPNKAWYPQTGHHIGHDLACPIGTPVRAPWNGKIIVAGWSDTIGYFCHYKYTHKGETFTERYLHLQSQPVIGSYKRGKIIARTGDTGSASKGIHFHFDIHVNDVDITSLNSQNFRSRTINPAEHYV